MRNEKWIVKQHAPDGFDARRVLEKITEEFEPRLREDEMLLKTLHLGIQSYLPSAISMTAIGKAPSMGAVMEVIQAGRKARFGVGDRVMGVGRSERFLVSTGIGLRPNDWDLIRLIPDYVRIDPALYSPGISLSLALGVLGTDGMTAFYAIRRLLDVQADDCLFIAGASGKIGSIAGQLAKATGVTRLIGTAGSRGKADALRSRGFDHVILYTHADTEDKAKAEIDAMAPDGVDKFLDIIGGHISDAVFASLRPHAKVVVCDQLAVRSGAQPRTGPRILGHVLRARATVRGFFVLERLNQESFDEHLRDAIPYLEAGKIDDGETLYEGFDQLPEAVASLGKYSASPRGNIAVQL